MPLPSAPAPPLPEVHPLPPPPASGSTTGSTLPPRLLDTCGSFAATDPTAASIVDRGVPCAIGGAPSPGAARGATVGCVFSSASLVGAAPDFLSPADE